MEHLSVKEAYLVLGVIDNILVDTFGHRDHLTEQEREEIVEGFGDIFDTTSPQELRSGLIDTTNKLHRFIKSEEAAAK